MPAVRRTRFMELFWRVHRGVFRASGGRIGSRVGPLPVLLLSVRGRKSQREPPWWLTLRDAGQGEVMLDGEHFGVRAREAEGAERERLWSEAKKRDEAFAEYEKRISRRIAVVVLERV